MKLANVRKSMVTHLARKAVTPVISGKLVTPVIVLTAFLARCVTMNLLTLASFMAFFITLACVSYVISS
jgi:hypothetical protein